MKKQPRSLKAVADDVIREFYPEHGSKACVKRLRGWTCDQIRDRAKRIQVKNNKRLGQRAWTTNELFVVRELYADYGPRRIQQEFLPYRTWESIYGQAVRLGLRMKGEARAPVKARLRYMNLSRLGYESRRRRGESREQALDRPLYEPRAAYEKRRDERDGV